MTSPSDVEQTCGWERCTEKATVDLKWRRDPDARVPVFDVAHYCDAHAHVARTHGAIEAG